MSTEAVLKFGLGAAPARQPVRIEKTEFGTLVYAEMMSVEELDALNKEIPGAVMVAGVAKTYNAFMALCDPKMAETWITAAAQHANNISNGDIETEWVLGPYTGASSETIFSVLAKRCFYHLADPKRRVPFRVSVPGDPDDFSRCHRLLETMPGWAERIGEVGEVYKTWKPFSDHWPELTALWLEERGSGVCPKLYARLQELGEESRVIQQLQIEKALHV